jgi:NADPH-dependent 2,4-dienoyl-CoA reductase/sulfur reductase-like enzyme
VKLISETGSGRLLGAQVVGGPGSGKRIDVLATAIWAGLTAEDLAGCDLSYAPPFSPVYDPVVVAARAVSRTEQG